MKVVSKATVDHFCCSSLYRLCHMFVPVAAHSLLLYNHFYYTIISVTGISSYYDAQLSIIFCLSLPLPHFPSNISIIMIYSSFHLLIKSPKKRIDIFQMTYSSFHLLMTNPHRMWINFLWHIAVFILPWHPQKVLINVLWWHIPVFNSDFFWWHIPGLTFLWHIPKESELTFSQKIWINFFWWHIRFYLVT